MKRLFSKTKISLILLILLILILLPVACSLITFGPSPAGAVSNFLSHVRSGELEEAHRFITAPFSLYEIEGEYRDIFGGLSYENITEEIDGNQATVTLTLTTVDFIALMSAVIAEVQIEAEGFYRVFNEVPEDQMLDITRAILTEKMTAYDAPKIITEIAINLEKTRSRWTIQADYSLADTVTGGMFSFSEQMRKRG